MWVAGGILVWLLGRRLGMVMVVLVLVLVVRTVMGMVMGIGRLELEAR
jgi:hypothetical protein